MEQILKRSKVMPYIPEEDRKELQNGFPFQNTPGELNFVITERCHEYIKLNGLRYTTLNEVIGVLECCKQEFYRQVVSPYEDKKKAENGPISPLDAD